MGVIIIILWVLIALSVIWTLVVGIDAIVVAWKASRARDTSSVFYPFLIETLEGNLITIILLYILSFPVWIVLNIVIASNPIREDDFIESDIINNQDSNHNKTGEPNALYNGYSYWYVENQVSVGPLRFSEIRNRNLTNDTLVYRSDMSDWKPMYTFKEFFQ